MHRLIGSLAQPNQNQYTQAVKRSHSPSIRTLRMRSGVSARTMMSGWLAAADDAGPLSIRHDSRPSCLFDDSTSRSIEVGG
jgi:hypothetical protein